ncbi:MAG: GGDEF domain-containing protein, partial [Actinomycetota bacterium]|nr:GGDEF domain-containing protein [Actinomycetota bacterium]
MLTAVAYYLAAQAGHTITLVIGAIAIVALAALIIERDRATSRLQSAEATASAVAAERSALGQIATAIAHQQSTDKALGLVTSYAAEFAGGSSARLERLTECDTKPAPGRVRTVVMTGKERWGTLVIEGVPEGGLPAGRHQLLQHLADLAGLGLAGAQTRAQLLTEASTDSLTGLSNQRSFQRHLGDEVSRAKRHRRPVTLILLDLDRFKAVNDARGQLAGDHALSEIAARVRGAVRMETHVARLGGDELAVVLPECDAEGGHIVANR